MSERRGTLALALLGLLPVACCVGISLLAAAGAGVALAAWIGGATAGAAALAAVALLLAPRLRRRRGRRPPLRPVARGLR